MLLIEQTEINSKGNEDTTHMREESSQQEVLNSDI